MEQLTKQEIEMIANLLNQALVKVSDAQMALELLKKLERMKESAQ